MPDTQDQNAPTAQAIVAPAMPDVSAGPSAPRPTGITNRRASVASCRNLFDVEGNIMEVGFDRLNRPAYNVSNTSNTKSSDREKANEGSQPVQPSQPDDQGIDIA